MKSFVRMKWRDLWGSIYHHTDASARLGIEIVSILQPTHPLGSVESAEWQLDHIEFIPPDVTRGIWSEWSGSQYGWFILVTAHEPNSPIRFKLKARVVDIVELMYKIRNSGTEVGFDT